MSNQNTHVIPGEVLPYGEHGVVNLQGPSGQVIELVRDGVNTIQWAPVDKRALEVELRMRILSIRNAVESDDPPMLQAKLQMGHGKITWDEPQTAVVAGDPPGALVHEFWTIPARGVVWRMAAREMKVLLKAPVTLGLAAPYDSVSVQVSFLPCVGMEVPLFPKVDWPQVFGDVDTFHFRALPMAANEWRAFGRNGLPIVDGSILCLGLAGETDIVPYAQMADFVPIPFWATSYTALVDDPPQEVYLEFKR